MAGGNQFAWRTRRDHPNRIGPFQAFTGLPYGFEQREAGFQKLMDLMNDGLGIGFRLKDVAFFFELCPQHVVVLDDAVMNHGHVITTKMRMCIPFRRNAMRRPAGMRNAHVAIGRRQPQGLFKFANLSFPAHAGQRAGCIDDRDARRVISAIFKPPKPLQQDRRHDPV